MCKLSWGGKTVLERLKSGMLTQNAVVICLSLLYVLIGFEKYIATLLK